RVQRQVHGQPAGAARRLLRHAPRSHAPDLSQLLLSPPALAVHGPAPRHGDRVMLNRNMRELLSERFALVDDQFATAVLDGLSRPQKTLPCRFFYDARGSELFEEITRLPEYYPTRTETAILQANAEQMIEGLPAGGGMVEFGSGSSLKTEILLRRLPRLSAYVMIDVSQTALLGAKERLARHLPALDVRSIVADFSFPVALPQDLRARAKIGFFPGSTIGNLTPSEAVRL